MPKIRWGVEGSAVDAVEVEPRERYTAYDGPIPQKYSILDMEVKRVTKVDFSTGSDGLKILLVCTGEGKQAKYKGLPVFDNIVVTESMDWKIRQWCDAIGAEGKDWDNTVTDNENPPNVTKFGRVKVEGLVVQISTKLGANQNGEPRVEVGDYVSLDEDLGSTEDGDSGTTPF